MVILLRISVLIVCFATLVSCKDDEPEPPAGLIQLNDVKVGPVALDLSPNATNDDIPVDKPIVATFSQALDRSTVAAAVILTNEGTDEQVALDFAFLNDDRSFSALPTGGLEHLTSYSLKISSSLKGSKGEEFPGFTVTFTTAPGLLTIQSASINGQDATGAGRITGVPLEGAVAEVVFSHPLDPSTVSNETVRITGNNETAVTTTQLAESNTKLIVTVAGKLRDLTRYSLYLSPDIRGAEGEEFNSYTRLFYTAESDTPKFPAITNDQLLTLVQEQTFRYFYDFAHPVSGMARERNSSGDIVTTGGTGFGLMAMIVGIERNFISRAAGIERFEKVIGFLETADRFHGAWPHWMNGATGDVVPFSTNDNGGDLVETSFLVQGLLTVRSYLNKSDPAESALAGRITQLWETVEWDWYTRGGQNVLYWHWSPTVDWAMNHQIRGHNETLITYVLAASSPTHPIDEAVYHEGYARNGGIRNGRTFYGITLPLGEDYGGPLFFAHYSFLGLDPRNLSDTYANYWDQNVNHTLINRAYVVDNPKDFVGYSASNWGLTASDNHMGYSAHSPLNDLGVISPTAALSSFPYTPEQSMAALEFFYYKLGDRLWGEHGFVDAFNLTEGWFADSYLAIDQGPIVVMIENYRTGLLWDLFMQTAEVQTGLTKLGFTF